MKSSILSIPTLTGAQEWIMSRLTSRSAQLGRKLATRGFMHGVLFHEFMDIVAFKNFVNSIF